VIIADTGGILALLDADDRHHEKVLEAFDAEGDRWLLPWAILPEIDYLATKYLGPKVALAFAQDVASGVFRVEGYSVEDMKRAITLQRSHSTLRLGLVDSIVMAMAVRHRASAIVTLDARHFRAVRLNVRPPPRLIPLDA
jgi:predicted nucleic acid-binding protein